MKYLLEKMLENKEVTTPDVVARSNVIVEGNVKQTLNQCKNEKLIEIIFGSFLISFTLLNLINDFLFIFWSFSLLSILDLKKEKSDTYKTLLIIPPLAFNP